MEIQENEIISCILTVGVSLFVLVNHRAISQIPRSNLLLQCLVFLLLSNFFTVLEGVMLTEMFNFLEHLSYAASLVCLALWVRAVYQRGDGRDV